MKKLYIVIILSVITLNTFSQLEMAVARISISKIRTDSLDKNKEISLHDYNIPKMDIQLFIVNLTDSVVTIDRNEMILHMQYWFEGKKHSVEIRYYTILEEPNEPFENKIIELEENESILIEGTCHLAEFDSILFNRFIAQKDNTLNVLRILPTVKYLLKSRELELESNYIYDVTINDGSE